MKIGWIDFSKDERDKVLTVLDSLTEQGTLDELGIAPIRDGFADIFFPGTSTLQTRAKYFLLIPYACKDLERGDITSPNAAYAKLYAMEKEMSEILHRSNPKEWGIIGADSLKGNDWVKRPPSTLYWAGLRRFGIFGGNSSLFEYLKAVCALKHDKDTLKRLGNRNDGEDCDDKDAGAVQSIRFFSLPTYSRDWKENLTVRLTREEAEYLKNRICRNAMDSALAYILNSKNTDVFNCESFFEFNAVLQHNDCSEDMKVCGNLAVDFAMFVHVLWVIYNVIVSDGNNTRANSELDRLTARYREYAGLDLEAIFLRLKIKSDRLKNFLREAKKAMLAEQTDTLKALVKEHECRLKGAARAKTNHVGTFDSNKWFCGEYPDYRFRQAKQLLKDIADGEVSNV